MVSKIFRIFPFLLAAALVGFGVGYSLTPAETRLWSPPPEHPRYESVSRLLDRRLEAMDDFFELNPFPLEISITLEASESIDLALRLDRYAMVMRDEFGSEVNLKASYLYSDKDAPLILALHGMGGSLDAMLQDIDYHKGIGMALAKKGFGVLIPERLATGYEERATLALKAQVLGTQLESLEMQQLGAWLDYFSSRKIGVYGISLGGFHALLLGSLDEGVRAVYVSGYITDRFSLLFKRYPTPVDPPAERFMRTFYKGDLPMYAGPIDDIGLIRRVWPRNLMIETGQQDKLKSIGVGKVEPLAREVYAERPNALSFRFHDGAHEADPEATVNWFEATFNLD